MLSRLTPAATGVIPTTLSTIFFVLSVWRMSYNVFVALIVFSYMRIEGITLSNSKNEDYEELNKFASGSD